VSDALDAWIALERTSFRRTRLRHRPRVTDGRGERAQVALWGLVHVLWAALDLRSAGDQIDVDELASMIDAYRRRGGFAAKPPTYRRYFDDNAWLGLVALGLDDRARAASILGFVRTGEHPDGGIRWVEGGASRNTCSTASAAWLAASLGRTDLAARWMGWLDATLRSPDGRYADRIDGERIDPTVWSYNQGASVAALHALGRDRDAVATARASLAVFDGERLWREPPPFVAIWFRALRGVPAVAEQTHDVLRRYVERLLAEARDPATGLFTRGGLGSYDGTTTIDQAAIVQLLTMQERTATR
jgi:glycosyl hydrolase family 76